jgi:hypothetical protein
MRAQTVIEHDSGFKVVFGPLDGLLVGLHGGKLAAQ